MTPTPTIEDRADRIIARIGIWRAGSSSIWRSIKDCLIEEMREVDRLAAERAATHLRQFEGDGVEVAIIGWEDEIPEGCGAVGAAPDHHDYHVQRIVRKIG